MENNSVSYVIIASKLNSCEPLITGDKEFCLEVLNDLTEITEKRGKSFMVQETVCGAIIDREFASPIKGYVGSLLLMPFNSFLKGEVKPKKQPINN
jgi:hypothetical protein